MPQNQIDWRTELDRRSVAQVELAERAGLNPHTVSAIVTGKRKGHPATVRKLDAALKEFDPILLDTRRERG
jgi:transcriptional regulator with XRE-family HTH domain